MKTGVTRLGHLWNRSDNRAGTPAWPMTGPPAGLASPGGPSGNPSPPIPPCHSPSCPPPGNPACPRPGVLLCPGSGGRRSGPVEFGVHPPRPPRQEGKPRLQTGPRAALGWSPHSGPTVPKNEKSPTPALRISGRHPLGRDLTFQLHQYHPEK